VFAAGDVRSGSAKRVASAAGEGSVAATLVTRYLQELEVTGSSRCVQPDAGNVAIR
jgi:thioredoxin reductase (NADPH)